MSQTTVVVPPADPTAPVAAPPAATVVIVPPTPTATAVAAPVVAPVAGSAPITPQPEDPNWFKPRIAQATKSGQESVFKALGVKDEAEAKALLERARAAEEATKTELQRAQDRAKGLEATAARVVDLEKTVKARADVELAALTEPQRAAVASLAGDDPARTLTAIDALKPTWVAPAAPAVVTTVVAPAAPAAPAAPVTAPATPATTSPPPNAPSGTTTSPPDHKAEWTALKATNPHRAALYLNQHINDIYPRR